MKPIWILNGDSIIAFFKKMVKRLSILVTFSLFVMLEVLLTGCYREKHIKPVKSLPSYYRFGACMVMAEGQSASALLHLAVKVKYCLTAPVAVSVLISLV